MLKNDDESDLSGGRGVGQILQDDFELWFLPCKLFFNHFFG
jgi:hypothetical protein